MAYTLALRTAQPTGMTAINAGALHAPRRLGSRAAVFEMSGSPNEC